MSINPAYARRREALLEVTIAKLRRRASQAATDPEIVNAKLEDAIAVFSETDYSNLTVEGIGKAGGRINRYAKQLLAAERLKQAEAKLEEVRAV